MKIRLFSIYDTKSVRFAVPFPAVTPGVAVRMVLEACTPDSAFAKWPHEFELYEMGEFDDETGVHSTDHLPRHVTSVYAALAEQQLHDAGPSPEQVRPSANTNDQG